MATQLAKTNDVGPYDALAANPTHHKSLWQTTLRTPRDVVVRRYSTSKGGSDF